MAHLTFFQYNLRIFRVETFTNSIALVLQTSCHCTYYFYNAYSTYFRPISYLIQVLSVLSERQRGHTLHNLDDDPASVENPKILSRLKKKSPFCVFIRHYATSVSLLSQKSNVASDFYSLNITDRVQGTVCTEVGHISAHPEYESG